MTFWDVKLRSKNGAKLRRLPEASWARFWKDFGCQNGAKMGPKREVGKSAKTLKNQRFFNDFGVSGWSKMSEKWVSRGLQDRMARQEGKMSENGAKLAPR